MNKLALSAGCAALICFVAVSSLFAAPPITVDPADITSKADFQAVLDAASPGVRIQLLGGIYDFSAGGPPLRITKSVTIENAEADNPPVLVGTGDFSGGSVGPNVGFAVEEQSDDINGLTIKGLHFQDFTRAIMISPFESIAAGGDCVPNASGVVRHLRISDNHFENNARAIQHFGGGLDEFTITSNTFLDSLQIGVLLFGEGILGCDDPPFTYIGGRSAQGEISKNVFDGGTQEIIAVNIVDLDITQNEFRDSLIGVNSIDDDTFSGTPRTTSVIGNVFTDVFFGVTGNGPAVTKRNQIANNTYSGSFLPILLDLGATNYTISNESFSGTQSGVDIYLCPDNPADDVFGAGFCVTPGPIDTKVIITDPDTVLVDLGTGTKIVGQ